MKKIKSLSQNGQFTLFGLANILIFVLIFNIFSLPFKTIYSSDFSATWLYFDFASNILNGQLPYRDFPLEYPPFAIPFILLPRLIANPGSYAFAFGAEILVFVLLGLFLVFRLSLRLKLAPWKSMALYTIALLAIGPIIPRQYDIFPAIITFLALYAFTSGKHKTSWFLLAVATLTKIYPIVLVPLLLLYHIRNHQKHYIRSGIITFAATVLIIVIPFLIFSPEGLLASFSYHAQRGIQLESVYSSILLLGSKLGWFTVETTFSFGAWNLVGAAADIAAKVSFVLLPLSLMATYWFIYRHMKRTLNQVDEIASYSLLVTAVLIATGKVLSPQYLIWFLPLIPFLSGRFRNSLWAVFIATGVLSYYIFPTHYSQLIGFELEITIVLLARNILIIAMIVLLLVHLRRAGSEQSNPLIGG